MKLKASPFLFVLFWASIGLADPIITIKGKESTIHIKSNQNNLYQFEIKEKGRHFVYDYQSRKWTFSKALKGDLASIQLENGKLFYFNQKIDLMKFAVSDKSPACDPAGLDKQVRNIASVVDAAPTVAPSCNDDKLPYQLTNRIKPTAFECIKNRAEESAGLFTADDVEKLNNELDGGKLEQIIECSPSVESFASQVLPTKILINEEKALAMSSEDRTIALAHEVTHLLIRSSCLSHQKTSCEQSYNEDLINEVNKEIIVGCMSDDEKNITRTVLMAAPRTYRTQWREANAKAVTKVLDSEPPEVRTNINLFGSELYSLMQKPGPRFFGQIKTFVDRLMSSADRAFNSYAIRIAQSNQASLPPAPKLDIQTTSTLRKAEQTDEDTRTDRETAKSTKPKVDQKKEATQGPKQRTSTGQRGSSAQAKLRSAQPENLSPDTNKHEYENKNEPYKLENMTKADILNKQNSPSFISYLEKTRTIIYLPNGSSIGAAPNKATLCFKLNQDLVRLPKCGQP